MDNKPWFVLFIPDIRAWATLGMFALVFYDLGLIAHNPGLTNNDLFKTVSTLLFGSGAFGLVCAFLWGGSKASVAAADTVNTMAKRSSDNSSTVTVTTPPAPSASAP